MSGIPAESLQNLLDLRTPPEEIKWRTGPGGKQLAYVDARYGMRVLDTLVGPANWQRIHAIGEGGKVACGIGINIDGEWVWKWDGAGETDIEGEKGSFSDAFKRALVNWGPTRDLYSLAPTGQQAPPRIAASVSSVPTASHDHSDMVAGLDEEGRGDCPIHHVAFRHVPAGVSKKTGKAYNAFWSCPEMGCRERPPHRDEA